VAIQLKQIKHLQESVEQLRDVSIQNKALSDKIAEEQRLASEAKHHLINVKNLYSNK